MRKEKRKEAQAIEKRLGEKTHSPSEWALEGRYSWRKLQGAFPVRKQRQKKVSVTFGQSRWIEEGEGGGICGERARERKRFERKRQVTMQAKQEEEALGAECTKLLFCCHLSVIQGRGTRKAKGEIPKIPGFIKRDEP